MVVESALRTPEAQPGRLGGTGVLPFKPTTLVILSFLVLVFIFWLSVLRSGHIICRITFMRLTMEITHLLTRTNSGIVLKHQLVLILKQDIVERHSDDSLLKFRLLLLFIFLVQKL